MFSLVSVPARSVYCIMNTECSMVHFRKHKYYQQIAIVFNWNGCHNSTQCLSVLDAGAAAGVAISSDVENEVPSEGTLDTKTT